MGFAVFYEGVRCPQGVDIVWPEPEAMPAPAIDRKPIQLPEKRLKGLLDLPEGDGRPKEIPLIGGRWPFNPPAMPLGFPAPRTAAEERQRDAFVASQREAASGPSLVYKSPELAPVKINLDPAHRVVFKFIAANSPDRMAAFASEYGLPDWGFDKGSGKTVGRMPMAIAESMRKAFAKIVEWYEAGDERAQSVLRPDRGFGDLRPVLMKSRNGRPPTLSLYVRDLPGFMCLEIGSLIAGSAKVLRCINCGTIFVAGSGTGRKRNAHYCSNRCRVAYQRARAAEAQTRSNVTTA